MNFWTDSVLVPCFAAWFIAQLIKVIITLVKKKKIDFRRFVGAGGMPSSHSSSVTCLAMTVGLIDGFCNIAFAICTVFAVIVMYDAAGVRRAAGQQAKILNKIVEEWFKSNLKEKDKQLKELLGHTPKEVFAGAILGIAVALIWYYLF